MFKLFSRLSKRERIIVYLLLAVISFLLFDRMVLAPIGKRMNTLNSEITSQKKKLTRFIHIVRQEESIIDEYNEYTKQLNQARSDEGETTAFQKSVEGLTKKTNLSVIKMQPSEVEKAGLYKKYAIKVDAEATAVQLTDFLYQLERDSQLMRVSEFSLSPGRGSLSVLKIYMLITKITLPEQGTGAEGQ
jgi:hypothetical protein